MAELDKELEGNRSQDRIKELSDKVELTSKERDELKATKEKAEADNAALAKERDFFQGFADEVAKNPSAKDFKDDIKSKVMSGYTLEDATIAVLTKAGKFSAPAQAERQTVAGGSAPVTISTESARSVGEMTQAERRAELFKREQSGEIAVQ